jgi:DNA-binding transcriptional LysR family regulator
MALQGLGIGRCPLYLVEQYVQTKRIKLLFESMETDGFPLYAIYPQSRHLTARVRTLIDHLVVYFEQ